MRHVIPFCISVFFLAVSCTGPHASDLKCENLCDPLGIDSASPHFSWFLSREISSQKAYRIQVSSDPDILEKGKADLWDSGKVDSDASVMIPYSGISLNSRDECFWRVKIWNENDKSGGWSRIARFSIGLLDGMAGEYIGAFEGSGEAPRFVSSFNAVRGLEYFVHVNSLGYHELFVNGKRIGDAVMVPAVSQMDRTSLIITYDISDCVVSGENSIEIWAGAGWYRKHTFNAVYDGPLVNVQVEEKDKGGKWNTIQTTGSHWKALRSGYTEPGSWLSYQFVGENADARVFGNSDYEPVDVVCINGIRAVPVMCEPNLVYETFNPVSIRSLDKLCGYESDGPFYVADMGKNFTGQMEYHFPAMPEGSVVTVLYSDNDRPSEFSEQDCFISSGREGGDTFRHHFAHHSFRYAYFVGLNSVPSAGDITAYRFHTGFADASSFECSDPDMNAIHDMVKYTLANLSFSGYQVDCPHIERLGYGGDGNSSTMSMQTMFEAAPMYINWLTAWKDVIHEDGGLPHTAPCPIRAGGGPYWCGFPIMASYRSLINYGDSRMIERFYPVMKHWLDYVDAYTVDGLLHAWPDTDYRGWYLGDWIPPFEDEAKNPESVDLVNNCSLSQNYSALAEIAGALGIEEDRILFTERKEALNKRIHDQFFHPESNTYGTGTQIDMAYPMLVGAVPAGYYPLIKDSFHHIVSDRYEGHLSTGLVGVPVVTECCVVNKDVQLMYDMLKRHDYPGYLYMIDNGATTTWEYWDDDARSHFHNCFNGIGTWFYQALGGLLPLAPGYRQFSVEPQVPDGIDWVDVSKLTPYGEIRVSWKKEGGIVVCNIQVPAGSTARYIFPDGSFELLNPGNHTVEFKSIN